MTSEGAQVSLTASHPGSELQHPACSPDRGTLHWAQEAAWGRGCWVQQSPGVLGSQLDQTAPPQGHPSKSLPAPHRPRVERKILLWPASVTLEW